MPTCFLVDNGSLRAASTINLRAIAHALSREAGQAVVPVSLLHSSAVDPGEMGGIPAEILERALLRRLERGENDFVILPLFFGPSLALTSYLPKRLVALRRKHPELRVRIAPCLFDLRHGTDQRLAQIVCERVLEEIEAGEKPPVVLVDHGSPAPEVTYARNFIAGQASVLLAGKIARLGAASMERREGDEYRFSEPLLENLLRTDGFNRGKVIIAMLFLSPGRHAGPGGDVAEICQAAEQESPGLHTRITGLIGDHPSLITVLLDRLREGLAADADASFIR